MSATAGQVRSINCTQCGAPLTLHGGHRVESLTCGFCGSVLDAHEDFKVVQTYANLNRPSSPLSLGMSGKLKNVEFTIIGVLEYRDAWHDRWLEYAIYSPTHGYAWLEYEHGHFLFSRRVRTVPDTPIVGRVKSRFEAGGREFTVFSRYRAVITFIEGELPFMAAIGDAVDFIDAIDPPFVYTVEQTQTEQEYVLGEYLDAAELYQSSALRTSLTGVTSCIPHNLIRQAPGLADSAKRAWSLRPLRCFCFCIPCFWFRQAGCLRRLASRQRQEQRRHR